MLVSTMLVVGDLGAQPLRHADRGHDGRHTFLTSNRGLRTWVESSILMSFMLPSLCRLQSVDAASGESGRALMPDEEEKERWRIIEEDRPVSRRLGWWYATAQG